MHLRADVIGSVAAAWHAVVGHDPVDLDPELPEGVARAVSEDVRGRLRASQVNAILRVRVPLMAVNAINALSFLFVLSLDGQLSPIAAAWGAGVLLLASWQLALARRRRGRPVPEHTSDRTVRRVIRSAFLFGLVWAVPGLALVPGLDSFSLAFALSLLTGMIAGGAFALYPIPSAALAFMGPVTLGGIAGLAAAHGALALGPALIAAMFLLIFLAGSRRHAELFVSDFLVRLELERRSRLIEDILEDSRLALRGTPRSAEGNDVRADARDVIARLTAGIAHDFNNWLSVIRGNAELLGSLDRVDPVLVREILAATDRGARQVRQLLTIAGQQRLRPQRVDLLRTLAEVTRDARPSLGPDYRLETDVGGDAGAPFVDPEQLASALMDLILNARDAMPEGGVIRITCRCEGAEPGQQDRVAVAVTDTGVGMADETRERAAEPFFTTKPFGKGHGLGLSCVSGFVAQSGGAMTIRSAIGRGTTVVLLLPVSPPSSTQGDPDPSSSEQRSLLLVGGGAVDRHATVRTLRGMGFAVEHASSVDEALSWLAEGHPVRLVLSDLLPGGSRTGLDLAREVAALRPRLTVIYLTSWTTEGETSAAPMLRHPLSPEDVIKLIERTRGPASSNAVG